MPDVHSPDLTVVPRRWRVTIALAIGGAAFALSLLYMSRRGYFGDFFYPWFAARLLLQGHSPYVALPGTTEAPISAPFVYPLPTVLATTPFAGVTMPLAAAIFFGTSAALLAYGLTRDGYHRLALLASAPFISAATQAQWSPLICAAALLPSLGFLVVLKPNLGLAVAAYRPSWRMIVPAALIVTVSVAVWPWWPAQWLHNVSRLPIHGSPIREPGGFLVLAALVYWRLPEARLLVAMACVPQLLFWNDQLPLLLVARTRRESLAVVAASLAGYMAWQLLYGAGPRYGPMAAPFIMASVYLPALLLVLKHGKERS